jgi:hypothetical protein
MKKLSIFCLVLALFLAACTPMIYGVPKETWDRMSEPERIEAMRVYEQEQQARRQAAEERARRLAAERERERARQAEAERVRRERIEAIHRGEGAYGELIRVRLQGGRVRVGDRLFHYEPATFTIADGETLNVDVVDRKGREGALAASYAGGALVLDGVRFPYDRGWGRGRLYAGTGTSGAVGLRGADVFIEVHNRSSRFERALPRLVLTREEPPPAPRPAPVVVREHEKPKPPPVAVREQDARRAAPPARHPAPPAADRPPRTLDVVILSGEMKVRGRNQHLERAVLRLAEGETRDLAVKAGRETAHLVFHYRNGALVIEGGRPGGHDDVRLPFEKEWQKGKVYRLDLRGRVSLEKVELKVTGVAGK